MSDNLDLPGFRFYPTEEELISFYLLRKLKGEGQALDMVIPVVHIYDYSPWDLPQFAGELCRGDPEQCFFFFPKQEKEARGGRPNRLTMEGYWKATGSPGDVYSSNGAIIGRKRTMVFYVGRAPNGTKTPWKMNEYKASNELLGHQASSSSSASSSIQPQISEEFSVCRVYKQSKCLRSFDRRPAQAAEGGWPVVHHQHDQKETTTTSEQDYKLAASFNNSSSEDHDANSDTNWDNIMATDDGPLW